MESKLKEMAHLIAEAERLHAIAMDDDNLDEDTTDAAYTEYWSYLRKIAAVLVDLIAVDEKTALRMAAHRRADIAALLARMAA